MHGAVQIHPYWTCFLIVKVIFVSFKVHTTGCLIVLKNEKHFKNEQKCRDAATKKELIQVE